MGVSTVTATRVYSVGVAGQLVMDQFPIHRTLANLFGRFDHPGQRADDDGDDDRKNTNAGVLGLDDTTEFGDFNGDGDGRAASDAAGASQAERHAGRRGQHRAHHARHARRDLRPHQQPGQRERHRAAVAARPMRPTTARSATGSTCCSAADGGISCPTPSWTRSPPVAAGRMAGTCAPSTRRRATPTSTTRPEFSSLTRQSLPVLGLVREQPHGVGVRSRDRCRRRAQPDSDDPQGDRPLKRGQRRSGMET